MNSYKHLRFLSLRLLDSPENKTGYRMQRNLQTNVHYYFYSGIEISEDFIAINNKVSDSLFNTIGIEGNEKVNIDICAIVGENGSGKSSIVDYIARIINNLSACILGEEYRATESEHLHYIEGVNAELYIQIRHEILKIRCVDTQISTSKYVLSVFEDETIESAEGKCIFERRETPIDLNYSLDNENIFQEKPQYFHFLEEFCYTIITNFSQYSFIPFNYVEEITPFRKEEKIRKRAIDNGYDINTLKSVSTNYLPNSCKDIDARCWLKGLFHKTDGFQTPIVITPMRDMGRIDIQKETKLAKERLLSLLFLKKEGKNSEYFFNRINGKLIIDEITIKKDNNENSRRYRGKTLEFLPNEECYEELYEKITTIIKFEIGIKDNKEHHKDIVWSYIVYKVLKIIFKCPRHRYMRNLINNIYRTETFNEDLYDTILDILHDHSHITRKLFRSINYLKYSHIGRHKSLKVELYGKHMEDIIRKREGFYTPECIEELLPPPVFSIDFKLYDHSDKEKKHPIPFHTLSSGEKQITYTLTSFYYYLSNIDSVDNYARRIHKRNKLMQYSSYETPKRLPLIQYEYVNVIFDEIELYFHPEMQRTFVYYLLDGLSQMQFRKLRNIQIMLVTHSPFILSDIPKENVLFLSKNGEPQNIRDMCTFGANIHTMLKHSFFLQDGSMGKYAQNTINDIITKVNRYTFIHQFKEIKESSNDNDLEWKLNYFKQCNSFILAKSFTKEEILHIENGEFEKLLENESKDYKDIQSLISLIQEPIIETNLLKQLRKWGNYVDIE
mgnify:CR=1 FL=1